MMQHWSRWNEVHLQKESETYKWTRPHATDNNMLLWSYSLSNRRIIKYFISCLVSLLSSPVVDVCVLKLTGLQRCCVHLHTICQQQTPPINQHEFQQHLINTLVSNQLFILIILFNRNMNKIWTRWCTYKSLMVWPKIYTFKKKKKKTLKNSKNPKSEFVTGICSFSPSAGTN